MAQSGFTPISIYYSTTASAVPTAANLVPGELAINTNDGKLYYEDSSGVVQVLATKSTGSIGGSNTQVQFNNSGSLGGSSSFTWDGTTVTATKFAGALNGTVGATTASTGAFTTLSTSSTTTFSGLTASTALALDASKNVVSVTNTGTGNNVLSASPTLTGTIAGASLSLSSLTSGRVTYAGTSGVLQDSANLTFDGTNLVLNAANPIFQGSSSTGSVLLMNNSAGAYIQLYGSSHATKANFTEFVNASSTVTISSGGIVTMSAYGAGAATFSAAGVISSVSDETWKTKDGAPTNTDAMLQKLEPGYWFYNEEKAPTFGQERQLGFYAQNVHEAIGEEAAPTPETYKDIDGKDVTKPWGYYDRSVLAVAVMSLKNALNTIEELKQRITALENK